VELIELPLRRNVYRRLLFDHNRLLFVVCLPKPLQNTLFSSSFVPLEAQIDNKYSTAHDRNKHSRRVDTEREHGNISLLEIGQAK
jgi:hypothetical protein